ncbi:MAG: hypothetical protein N3E40_02715 [Dehalococcoidia bacterium]|nr:hypothetical protein [Dehalococcoidia bacterium]
MDSREISPIKYEFLNLPYAFIPDDIAERFGVDSEILHEACKAIENDPDFIVYVNNKDGKKRLISKNSLYAWFARFNIRLAITKVCSLSEGQLLSHMNGLCLGGRWDNIPTEYLNFGQDLGLICHKKEQGRYNFPISYAISLLSPSDIKAAAEYLCKRHYYEDITPHFGDIVLKGLKQGLACLTERQSFVISKRQGILGSREMTLEEIGQQLQVTRERVRQIEVQTWKKLRRRSNKQTLVQLLLIYLLNMKGSLLIFPSSIQREIEFICKCLNIPFNRFTNTGIASIGDVNATVDFPTDFWKDLVNPSTRMKEFLYNVPLQLTDKDIDRLSEVLTTILVSKLEKSQKVYLALKKIGRPAHYSEIADTFAGMFPVQPPSEHSIHGILLREQHGIVWIGSKGMFALEEWGYERPALSIHDAIATIVMQNYKVTGKPVGLNVIQAEIGKYRKLVNPHSVMIATYCNPKLTRVKKGFFRSKRHE